MKNFLPIILILFIFGCQKKENTLTPNTDSKGGCPNQPQGSLPKENVEQISLRQGIIVKSGNISVGQNRGYLFDGKKGDRLSYKTKDDVCVWVYSPDATLLNGDELKSDGKYTIQLSALKGSTSFNVEMGFGSLSAASPSSSSSETPSSSSSTSSAPNIAGDLDQAKAEQLVKAWLDSKAKIFAPPFDRSLVKAITTGPLYQDITKSNGPIDWLQSNNSYYSYSKASVDKVWLFSASGAHPSLKVTISEDRVLYGKNGKPDSSESGASTSNWVYLFVQEDSVWKIYDYKKDN
jgi:hypothetical protein